MIERNIDYLTLSVPDDEKKYQNSSSFQLVPPIAFYKRGYRNDNSVRFYFGNPKSNKALVVISGFALLFERYMFENDAAMLDYWLSRGAKISRLDLAITKWIDEDFFTVSDVKSWFVSNKIESPYVEGGCKTINKILINAPEVPETLYIGDIERRGKRGIFRAYDKGLEQGILGDVATRIELELKHDNAHATAKRIAKTNDISGNFRAKFNVKNTTFDRLMDAPIADTTRNEAKPKTEQSSEMASRWKWLLETVAPALKSAIEYDRQFDSMDANLVQFLSKAGISGDMKKHAKQLADRMISDATETIDLLNESD
jgi:DNA relaxase NicK